MLYDWTNRPIEEGTTRETKPAYVGDRLVQWEPLDRQMHDASRSLTPEKLDAYFRDANAGDPRAQARLAMEILEKDWDTAQAIGVRVAAPCGVSYTFVPPQGLEEDATAKKIAAQANIALRGKTSGANATDIVGLNGLLRSMMGALLPGYSLAETIWGDGGREVVGYAPIDLAQISFTNSRQPLIISRNNANGLPLAPYKFVFHQHSAISGDATRGGLIRPLGWMFLFSGQGVRNLARFVEKFGMPFPCARLDDNAWEQDRHKIAHLIRNFGTDGGGVFSKAVELQFHEAANAGGDVFFRLLDYFGNAKTRVVLGQLASSGDAGGLSGGNAQSMVRQDLLEADCTSLAETVKRDIAAPWTMFNYGPNAPVPELQFSFAAPEDLEKKSRVLANLKTAGVEIADTEEASKIFGMKLQRAPAPAQPGFDGTQMFSGERDPAAARRALAEASRAANEKVASAALQKLNGDPTFLAEFAGPVADAIDEALAGLPDDDPTPEQAEEFNRRLAALLDAAPSIARKMDARALEEQLFEAMMAADANGRLQVLAGLGRGAAQ